MIRRSTALFVLVTGISTGALAQQDTVVVPTAQDTTITIITGGIPGQLNEVGTDTSKAKSKGAWRLDHSPTRAAIYSAIIPGAGQIYNRKYWKAPIAWLGLGISVAFIIDNNREYQRYKDAYLAVTDSDPNTVDEFNGQYSATSLLSITDQYHKWRDLSWIAFGAVYALNIMDAAVDAYFVRFDVSDDLSVQVRPSLSLAAQGAFGFSVSLHL